MKTHLLYSALIGIAFGCLVLPVHATSSSEPTCPVPSGVPCMPTIDVYRATNNADKVTSRDQGMEGMTEIAPAPLVPVSPATKTVVTTQALKPSGPVAYRPAEYAQLSVEGDALIISNRADQQPTPVTARVNVEPARTSEPYRVPAKIMEIYVAAWQDEQGDLHLPQRVVTEIEPRHWSLGAPVPDGGTSFHLLELPGEAAKDSRPAVQANTAASQSGH